MIEKLLGGLAGVGVAGTIAAAIMQPQAVGVVLAASGGAMGAAAATAEIKRRDQDKAEEANRVSNAFNYLYETNRGLIAPNQLSVLSGVELPKIEIFLSALANEQNGQFIPLQSGNAVNFPHPANMVQEMTTNATEWAKSQTNALIAENQQLKQRMTLINAARMSKAGVGGPPPRAAAPNGAAPRPPIQSPQEPPVEPWNNLL